MEHHPRCPAARLPKPYPGEVVVEEWRARECRCDLIALITNDTLDAAVAAVKEFHVGSCRWYYAERVCTCGLHDALKDLRPAQKKEAT